MLKIRMRWLLLSIMALIPSAAYAASFDCMKASSRVEKMICAHEELSVADERLARLYRAVLRKSSDKNALNAAQRSWVKKRNSAPDPSTLKKLYEQRIEELKKGAPDKSPQNVGDDGAGCRTAYYSSDGELEFNELGYGKVAFSLLVVNHQGHIGELKGVLRVVDRTAKYTAEECELNFTFGRDRVTVKQNFNKGTCGAGTNVALEGVYKLVRKKSSKR